jgi:SAM-dependent methyltransferase
MSDAVVWHDVECGGYAADLPLWRELAAEAGGPVLDLGAGTGRVALDLAERGHEVVAVDLDAELLDELGLRAERRSLRVERVRADARELSLGRPFALAIAPMQLVQILDGPAGRAALLAGVAACLAPGGTFAAAIANLDEAIAAEDAQPPLPDVGQRASWVYSSRPLDVRREPGGVTVEWLRQIVSPAGELRESRHTQRLEFLTPEELEAEAAAQGLRPDHRLEVAHTTAYIGSMVVVCRR